MSRSIAVASMVSLLALVALACDKPSTTHTTEVEVLQVQRFGSDPKNALTEVTLRYTECPGDAQRVARLEKSFSQCNSNLKVGDKLPAEIVLKYRRDRGGYRNDLVKLGDCPVKLDSSDEANHERIQMCRDLMASGGVVGVHCDRGRPPELLEKCPFLRRQ